MFLLFWVFCCVMLPFQVRYFYSTQAQTLILRRQSNKENKSNLTHHGFHVLSLRYLPVATGLEFAFKPPKVPKSVDEPRGKTSQCCVAQVLSSGDLTFLITAASNLV